MNKIMCQVNYSHLTLHFQKEKKKKKNLQKSQKAFLDTFFSIG